MFFNQLADHANNLAVIDGEKRLTYAQLDNLCDQFKQHLQRNCGKQSRKMLLFILIKNNLSGLVAYLACLKAGYSVLLVNPELSENMLTDLIKRYHPDGLIRDEGAALPVTTWYENSSCQQLDEQLALLLSTSGSTGSPKQVALSFANLQANANSIVKYLPIRSSDRGLCHLPLHYSYGLSVVNSHLLKGACCVLTSYSPVNRQFWILLEQEKITSFAGVPHSYQMLLKLRLSQKPLPNVRYFTQAGGKLDETSVKQLADYARQTNKQFFVMYGQTEATARMAYLEPHLAAVKPYAIGKAIPEGRLCVVNENGRCVNQFGVHGEIVYQGPNVMLGYVSLRADLACLSKNDRLYTGDLGYQDEEGDFVITGRLKRFVKIFGQRLSLDEIEQLIIKQGYNAYCSGDDNKLLLAIEQPEELDKSEFAGQKKLELARLLGLHMSAIEVLIVNALPVNANGKKDYQAIMRRYQLGNLYD